MNSEKIKEFERLAKPLIEFLNTELHPHTHILITTDSAEISEGLAAFFTREFVPD